MPLPAALLAAGPIAGMLGRIFGGAAKGSSDQRMAENQQALLQSQLRNRDTIDRGQLQNANSTSRAGMQNQGDQFRAGLDLERKQFQQREPNVQAGQALRGSLLNRIQPLSMTGGSERFQQSLPQMNSIIDAIGPDAREAGGLLAQRGLSGLRSGPTQFDAMPNVSLPDLLQLPDYEVAKLKQSGLLEKILGAGGLIGSTVGALGDLSSVTPKTPQGPYDGELGY